MYCVLTYLKCYITKYKLFVVNREGLHYTVVSISNLVEYIYLLNQIVLIKHTVPPVLMHVFFSDTYSYQCHVGIPVFVFQAHKKECHQFV